MYPCRGKRVSAQAVFARRPDPVGETINPAVTASSIHIREFCFPADYEPVYMLWQSMEKGVSVGRSDTLVEIEKKVARDPDLFLVAESDGCIVGSVVGGFDGRRGMIYHLAVAASFREQGVGSRLMDEVE